MPHVCPRVIIMQKYEQNVNGASAYSVFPKVFSALSASNSFAEGNCGKSARRPGSISCSMSAARPATIAIVERQILAPVASLRHWKPFDQYRQLRTQAPGCCPIVGSWPHELSTLKTFRVQAQPRPASDQRLQPVISLPAEPEYCTREWIRLQDIANLSRQPVEALANVERRQRQTQCSSSPTISRTSFRGSLSNDLSTETVKLPPPSLMSI